MKFWLQITMFKKDLHSFNILYSEPFPPYQPFLWGSMSGVIIIWKINLCPRLNLLPVETRVLANKHLENLWYMNHKNPWSTRRKTSPNHHWCTTIFYSVFGGFILYPMQCYSCRCCKCAGFCVLLSGSLSFMQHSQTAVVMGDTL